MLKALSNAQYSRIYGVLNHHVKRNIYTMLKFTYQEHTATGQAHW